jgi:hypothetical protein
MKVNLPVNWKDLKHLSEDEKLERRVLDKEENEIEHTEGFLTIDTDSIEDWNASDSMNTTIRTFTDKMYSVSMPHEEFDKLWTQLTGQSIIEIRVKQPKEKTSKKISK